MKYFSEIKLNNFIGSQWSNHSISEEDIDVNNIENIE